MLALLLLLLLLLLFGFGFVSFVCLLFSVLLFAALDFITLYRPAVILNVCFK